MKRPLSIAAVIAVAAGAIILPAAGASAEPALPDLSVKLTAPAKIKSEGMLIYKIAVANRGLSAAKNARLTLHVAAGINYLEADGGNLVPNGGAFTLDLGDLKADPSGKSVKTVDVFGQVGDLRPGAKLVTGVAVGSRLGDANPKDNNASTTTEVTARPKADIKITAKAPKLRQGRKATITLTVTNNGPAAVAPAIVFGARAKGIKVLKVTGAKRVDIQREGFAGEVPKLAAGKKATIKVIVKVTAKAKKRVVLRFATFGPDVKDPNPRNNEAQIKALIRR